MQVEGSQKYNANAWEHKKFVLLLQKCVNLNVIYLPLGLHEIGQWIITGKIIHHTGANPI